MFATKTELQDQRLARIRLALPDTIPELERAMAPEKEIVPILMARIEQMEAGVAAVVAVGWMNSKMQQEAKIAVEVAVEGERRIAIIHQVAAEKIRSQGVTRQAIYRPETKKELLARTEKGSPQGVMAPKGTRRAAGPVKQQGGLLTTQPAA